MPLLRSLTPEEAEILIHKINNSNRDLGDNFTPELLTSMTSNEIEEKLAKISEEENFLSKNRYRLQRTKLDHAQKSRMPIDESKIRDVLRNRSTFKVKVSEEIGNYDAVRYNPQFENGLLSYLQEASMGEMRDLVNELGI